MTPIENFTALLGPPERTALPLLAAAAQVPLYADLQCEPQLVVDQVQAWGERLQARVSADASPRTRLRLLNHFFFSELGFAGASDDYHSADNSYLHRVIERRRGIPITLSLLYMELGKAVNLRLQGVSFPAHFLVKLRLADGTVFIDVFDGGSSLSVQDLQARLEKALPNREDLPLGPFLRGAADRDILARLLRNLKAIHWQAQDWAAALEVVNRLIAVLPDAVQERRDRAQLYEELECPRAAVADLVAYLSMCAQPPDAIAMRERLERLRRAAARLN